MSTIGRKIKLEISEPWPIYEVIDGKVIGIHRTNEGRVYLGIEDTLTRELYVVSSRYVGDDVMDVFSGKQIIVGIGRPKTGNFIFNDPDFLSQLSYYGIGYIENL